MPIKSAYQKPCRERRHGFKKKKKVEANGTKREEAFLNLSRGILPMIEITSWQVTLALFKKQESSFSMEVSPHLI